jgi:uncharacterized protein YjdB
MSARRCIRGLLLLSVIIAVVGCANPSGLDSLTISPSVQALAVGQTAQFTAIGTFGNATHPTTGPISSGVTWVSSAPSIATVSATGLATAVGAGTTTITANAASFSGQATSTATLTVTGSSGGTAGGTVTSLAIIPGSQAVTAPGATGQFLAIGTTSSGATVNLSNQVAWSSSSPSIATVGATTGLATAVGQGSDTITAIYTPSGGSVVTGSATFSVSGGTTQKYTAISITPNSQALSASGQTSQLVALGTSGSTGLLQDVTNSPLVQWTSSIPTIAKVSPSGGLVTGVSAGNDTITAILTNPDGSVVTGQATIAVSVTPAPEPLLALTIIPSSLTVDNLQGTGQFLAIGTYATAPFVRDLTNSPNLTWISSFPNDFPVDTNSGGNSGATAGIVTAYASGSATIIAEATNPADGTIQTATAQFNCPLGLPNPNGDPPTPGTCIPGTQAVSLLETLTIYNEGLNNTSWEITAPSATGTANVIHCGPGWALSGQLGGSVCVATYPLGTTVILKASGAQFGGWSYNCTPSDSLGNTIPAVAITATGPNYCVVAFSPGVAATPTTPAIPPNTQLTVGAIFN